MPRRERDGLRTTKAATTAPSSKTRFDRAEAPEHHTPVAAHQFATERHHGLRAGGGGRPLPLPLHGAGAEGGRGGRPGPVSPGETTTQPSTCRPRAAQQQHQQTPADQRHVPVPFLSALSYYAGRRTLKRAVPALLVQRHPAFATPTTQPANDTPRARGLTALLLTPPASDRIADRERGGIRPQPAHLPPRHEAGQRSAVSAGLPPRDKARRLRAQ